MTPICSLKGTAHSFRILPPHSAICVDLSDGVIYKNRLEFLQSPTLEFKIPVLIYGEELFPQLLTRPIGIKFNKVAYVC